MLKLYFRNVKTKKIEGINKINQSKIAIEDSPTEGRRIHLQGCEFIRHVQID